MKGDLHTHTIHSDGACTPEQLFRLAHQAKLSALAVTDHDYLPPREEYQPLAEKYGITLIHGTELSTFDEKRGRRVHILCYFPENEAVVRQYCQMVCENRKQAGTEMARLVMERYPISMEDVLEATHGSEAIFKQHILFALMQAGYTSEMYGSLWLELFDNQTGSCLRNCKQPDVWEVVPAIRQAGAVVVMAHPYTYNGLDVLGELTEAGLLDGVEVWQSKTSPEQEEHLLAFANAHGLIPTGGSDFHGSYASRPAPLGCSPTPEESIRRLFACKEEKYRLR